VPLWRDDRFWKILIQLVVAAIVIGILGLFIHNLIVNLQRAGLEFTFSFLTNSSGFSIGETLIEYSPSDTYIRALLVGVLNTLRVVVVGIVLTTILGVIAGVATFSDNFLVLSCISQSPSSPGTTAGDGSALYEQDGDLSALAHHGRGVLAIVRGRHCPCDRSLENPAKAH